MSDNKIHTLGRIDQAIRGINSDGTDDGYIPPQSENGALERIEKSIKDIDIKGIKSGLPKVTNNDNGKVLQVKNGKWGKGDEKLVHISGDVFLDSFHEFSENDTLYLVSGEIEEDARLNESIESEAASEGIVTYYPTVIPPEENHEPWRAFHDNDTYGGWSTKYENEDNSAYIQYDFQNDFGVALSGIVFNTTYTYLGEEPAPEELPKIHLNLEMQVCDDSVHHNWTTIWGYDGEVNDAGLYGTQVLAIDHIYAVRLVCKNSIYDDGNAMISIGNFKFFGMVLNEESESREIWYKGHKFGNVNDGGSTESQTVTELTEDDYNSLTTSEKNNGTLYLVNGHEGDVHTIPVSSDSIDRYIENPSVCEDNVVGTSIESKYYGGVNIGNDFWFKTKIDLTNYSKFVYKLITGTAYSNTNPSWFYTIGFMRDVPGNYWYGNSSDYVVSKSYNQTETIYDDEEIDVSKLTGEYYLCVCCHGWNAQLYDLGLTNVSGKNSIKRNSVEYANDLGSNNSNVLLFQGNGSSNPEQIVLNDNYTEYDLLVFRTTRIADSLEYKLDKVFNVNGLETGDNLQDFGWTADNNYWAYQIANGTTLNRISNGNNFYLTNIYGLKL